MSTNWMDDIRSRMENYETDAPKDLWEDIERKLNAAPHKPHKHKKAALLPMWTRYATGIAAAVAVAFLVGHYYLPEPETNTTNIAEISKPQPTGKTDVAANATTSSTLMADANAGTTDIKPHTNENHTYIYNKETSQPQLATSANDVEAATFEPRLSATVATDSTYNMVAAASLAEGEEVPVAQPQIKEKEALVPAPKTQPQPARTYAVATSSPNAGRGHLPMTFGLVTAGSTAASLKNTSTGFTYVTSTGPDGADWVDDPMLGIGLFNQGKEIETSIKHRLPVRIGLTAEYALSPRFSIETGVTYSLLLSDFREGSKSHYVDGKQTLHYLGIPIKAKYTLFSYKKLNLYASAGILTEKRIKGKQERSFILDYEKRETETESIHSKPIQFHVNAAAGLQFAITPRLGIYAEPGVTYSFKDGSSVATIYGEKPFNFDLNVGLRLTLGK